MAAMTLDPREPDMSRFIDSYKYERQRGESIKQLSGGVSLPLNSDGYEDRQRFLKEERHKEMVEHQEKEPVYYRLGTPEYGLNLGNYDKQRHAMNLERQRDYNNLMKKQRKVEQERIEQRRRNRQPPAAPQGHQIDYNENQELARAEERKAYQDHQGKYSVPTEGKLHAKAPINYEESRKDLAEERKHDYALFLEKKAKEDRYRAMRGRPVTPPGMGLNVGQYDRQVRETKAQKTKEYKDSLDQQASERLRYRFFERLAETSPNYYKYRDEERPLVGSPRDINPALFEKESKNIYDKNETTPRKSVSPTVAAVKGPVEDPNVKAFLEIEKQRRLEQRQYREELLKQQKEQMFLKAQRDTELSVLDRKNQTDSQYLASKPPAGPGYKPRDEPVHHNQGYWNEGHRAPSPRSVDSEAQRRQRDDGVPLAFQTNTYSRPRSRNQERDEGYVPSLSDAPVRGQFYDERSRPLPRDLMPPRSPHRRTPPPRTPPHRREFVAQSEHYNRQPRSPRRKSPPPRTPPPKEQQSDQGSTHQTYADVSPRRVKALVPEESQYDKMRKEANLERKEDYNKYIKEKEENRKRNVAPRPAGHPAEVVKGPYYSSDNYESYQGELRRKQIDDYKEYLKKNYQPPPGSVGLPLEQARYEPKRLTMEAERNLEYNEHLKKSPRDHEKAKGSQGLPLDPKQSVEKAKWLEKQRNRDYNEFLKKEQEARQLNHYEDITNPFLPPPPHNPHLPEPYQTNPHIYQQSMRAPYPKATSAPPEIPVTPSKLSLPLGQYDDIRPFLIKQRNKDYNSYKEQLSPVRAPRVTPEATTTAVSLPIGQFDETIPLIEKQRIDEFNKSVAKDKLSKKSPREKAHTPPYLQGLPIGQHHYEPLYRAMEYQRNKEYNDFINKKFTQTSRKAKSEPDRAKASFYLGNDFIHAEKRRFLEAERQKEYNQFLKQQPAPPSKDIAVPTDSESGLPIGQQHHEVWKKFLRGQRNKEYNQLVDKTSQAPNRNWKESDNGLLLPEDHSVEYKKRELQAQRKKEYQEHLAQRKGPPNHYWPEPEPGRAALWLKKGEYDGIKQMYQQQRKKEFIDTLDQKRQPELSQTPRAQSQPTPVQGGYFNPMVDSMGRYEELRQRMRDMRRKEFLDFMDKAKHRFTQRRYGDKPPTLAKDENPLVYSMGRYELEQIKKVRDEAHKDLANFYEEQRKNMSPRRYEEEIPRLATAEDPLVNHMGHYDKEKEKYILQRHKDFAEYSQKYQQQHHSPWNNFVYPLNAYLEHPVVEKMGHEMDDKRRLLRDERKRDYERYLNEQRGNEVPRRNDYGADVAGPYNGMFHGLGEHGNQKDDLNQQRRQEYNDMLDQQYSQRERPSGRPSWAKEPITDGRPNRGRSPLKSPAKTDHYEQMLHEKRREEAQRRRYDDPEYQDKLARLDSRERGPARDQPRYGY